MFLQRYLNTDILFALPDPLFNEFTVADEIGKYMDIVGCPYEFVDDRGEAIRRAIAEADENTVVLVLVFV